MDENNRPRRPRRDGVYRPDDRGARAPTPYTRTDGFPRGRSRDDSRGRSQERDYRPRGRSEDRDRGRDNTRERSRSRGWDDDRPTNSQRNMARRYDDTPGRRDRDDDEQPRRNNMSERLARGRSQDKGRSQERGRSGERRPVGPPRQSTAGAASPVTALVRQTQNCQLCGKPGHSATKCPLFTGAQVNAVGTDDLIFPSEASVARATQSQ